MNDSRCKIDDVGKRWFNSDWQHHRVDGPAIEYNNGDFSWYINGILHRIDGPALDWNDDKQWYYHGKRIYCDSQEEFERLLRLKAFW